MPDSQVKAGVSQRDIAKTISSGKTDEQGNLKAVDQATVSRVWDAFVTADEGLEEADAKTHSAQMHQNADPKDSNCELPATEHEQAYTFDPAGHAADDPMDFFLH